MPHPGSLISPLSDEVQAQIHCLLEQQLERDSQVLEHYIINMEAKFKKLYQVLADIVNWVMEVLTLNSVLVGVLDLHQPDLMR